MCLGFALAQMELTLMISRFAQRLDLEPTASQFLDRSDRRQPARRRRAVLPQRKVKKVRVREKHDVRRLTRPLSRCLQFSLREAPG